MINITCDCANAVGCGWHVVCGRPDAQTFAKLPLLKRLKLIFKGIVK